MQCSCYVQAYVFTGCVSPTGRPMQSMFMAAGIYGGIKDKMPERFLNVISNDKIPFTVRYWDIGVSDQNYNNDSDRQ
jgi:hypothetical protein